MTGLLGSGVDMVSFSVLTLLFSISEKVATPTSVVLMAINTSVGFYWRHLIQADVSQAGHISHNPSNEPTLPWNGQEAWEYLAVCVPVVVICAPLGSLVASHFHRQARHFQWLSFQNWALALHCHSSRGIQSNLCQTILPSAHTSGYLGGYRNRSQGPYSLGVANCTSPFPFPPPPFHLPLARSSLPSSTSSKRSPSSPPLPSSGPGRGWPWAASASSPAPPPSSRASASSRPGSCPRGSANCRTRPSWPIPLPRPSSRRLQFILYCNKLSCVFHGND